MASLQDALGFHGRAVFVTGAGAGIGRATAMAFAALGAAVAVTDIDAAAAQAVTEEIAQGGGAAFAFAVDVADESQVDAAVAEALARFGRIDVLVNNAGIGARVATVDMPSERWQRVLDVGLNGAFHCARAVGRHMVARRAGAVVNVASIMGLTGGGLYPNPAITPSRARSSTSPARSRSNGRRTASASTPSRRPSCTRASSSR